MKDKFIKIRVSILEKELIKKKSDESGMPVSELIRGLIFNYKMKPTLSDDEIICYKNLVKFADNFRRISNAFKDKDFKLIKSQTEETCIVIREHLNKFK